MKRLIYILIFFISSASYSLAQDSISIASDDTQETIAAPSIGKSDNDSIQAATTAYNEGDFYKAIGLLERQVKVNKANNLESASLYYNLGNAYFRVNELGYARLNYERAALLNPSDKDIRHNIEYVVTRIEDKILERDTLFLSTWFNTIQNIFSSDAWAVVGVVFFLLLMACLFAFFFTQQIIVKKTSFYVALVALIFCIFANVFAFRQKHKLVDRDTAVIVVASVSVVTSPDINSKELFRLHSGTKVKITKDDRNWLEIEIDNGSIGWVQRDKIEII